MKTHHFILKEDGNIYVIPEMPARYDHYHGDVFMPESFDRAIDRAKESALLVKNQDGVKKAIYDADPGRNTGVDTYFRLGEIYPLECGIEVKEVFDFEKDCATNSFYNTTKVALITFSEPSKEVVEEPTQEELWEEIFHELCADPGNVMPSLLPIIMNQYTITRKQK